MFLLLGFLILTYASVSLLTFSNNSSLERRTFTAQPSCRRRIPNDPTGRLYNKKASITFKDARALTDNVLADPLNFISTTAFSHYFLPTDVRTVIDMYATIAGLLFNEPSIPYACGDDQEQACHEVFLIGATNKLPGRGRITMCDNFFKDFGRFQNKVTRYNIGSKPFTNRPDG